MTMENMKGNYVLVTKDFYAVEFEGLYFETLEEASYALVNHTKKSVTDIDGFIVSIADFEILEKWIEGNFQNDEFKEQLSNQVAWDLEDAKSIVNNRKIDLL